MITHFCSNFQDGQTSVEDEVAMAELMITDFIVKHNLPISLSDDLVGLIKSVGNLSDGAKLRLGRTKTSGILTKVLARRSREATAQILRDNFFLLMADETTDISAEKSLEVCARTVYKGKLATFFYVVLEVQDAKARAFFKP